tara:strand:- start:105 stop:458 length:354 start_codon:yes stop_codon:yes gene_type:complete
MAETFNPDSLNELPLSDYEKGYLTAIYDTFAEPEAQRYFDDYSEENSWFMQVVDKRTFDLCTFLSDEDNINSDKVCIVYECYEIIDNMGNPSGEYTTDTSLGYYLKGDSNVVEASSS